MTGGAGSRRALLGSAGRSLGLVAILAACRRGVDGDHGAPPPSPPRPPGSVPIVPTGFGSRTATLRTAAGDAARLCVWVADTAELRRRGLRGVDELGADGMSFHWEQPTSTSFTMSRVRVALTLATFDADGVLLEVLEMAPCPSGDGCRSHRLSQPFVTALEVESGRWSSWLQPGTTLTFGGNDRR